MRWKPERATQSFHVFPRATLEEKKLLLEAADAEERDFSDWVRRTLRRRANVVLSAEGSRRPESE